MHGRLFCSREILYSPALLHALLQYLRFAIWLGLSRIIWPQFSHSLLAECPDCFTSFEKTGFDVSTAFDVDKVIGGAAEAATIPFDFKDFCSWIFFVGVNRLPNYFSGWSAAGDLDI